MFRRRERIAGRDVVRDALQVQKLWEKGLDGKGATVAVLDTGVDASKLEGPPPLWEHDYTGEDETVDRDPNHGTAVANCIRAIAPRCHLINAKVVPHVKHASKRLVVRALRDLAVRQVDVVNLSLDFDADGCAPRFYTAVESVGSVLSEFKELDRDSCCDLCLACWDLAEAGIAVVVAAGNRWGAPIECPGQSPGALCPRAVLGRQFEDRYWRSRSRLRRWWDWHFMGTVGQMVGTSYSAAYASGQVAVLMPLIRPIGWLTALHRLTSAGPVRSSGSERSLPAPRAEDGGFSGSVTTTVELQRRLTVCDWDPLIRAPSRNLQHEREIVCALELAFEESATTAHHLKALEGITAINPSTVSRSHRLQVARYLGRLLSVLPSPDRTMGATLDERLIRRLEGEWRGLTDSQR